MQFKPTASLAAGFLLAAFAIPFAQAQAPAKPPRLVNRDELRVCMNSELELGNRRKALEARKIANRDEIAAIKAETAKLSEDEKAVDGGDERKVRAFKRTVDAHNARVKASNEAAVAFNNELESLNKAAIAYNETCAGITFNTEDKEAILKEREAAPK